MTDTAAQSSPAHLPADSQAKVKIGVLTSGGDAQGMNAIVRAVVRTSLQLGAQPYAFLEGWRGPVEGGDLIKKMAWDDVSSTINKGGTAIGTARSDEFRERSGIKKAVKNFVLNGIDRLVVIGGDGTLTGANELRQLWPELLAELVDDGELSPEQAANHETLMLAGVVGSIDNDLVGTDMTVGADSALHRIIEAIDAIQATAASHQRTFIIEVMGRHCGYLALMSAIAGGCDYVFIPELPPANGWEDELAEKLRIGRAGGRRDSLIIVAEGATDRSGNPITAQGIREALKERMDEDPRITSLGHVQRGGTPSAYDRWMPTLLGYTAAYEMFHATPDTEPMIIGTRRNKLKRLPMMEAVSNTRAVAKYLAEGNWEDAIASRGGHFHDMIALFDTLSSPIAPERAEDSKRIGIMHAGGLAPGMNPAARAAVKLGIDRGYTMLGIEGGFPGLLAGNVRELKWHDVEGWAGDGGAYLGTRRTIPTIDQYYALGRAIEDARLDGLIIIGGFKGYKMVYEMQREQDRYPAFKIPMILVPTSIDNNLPGAEYSIGADTTLNWNTETIDRIRQSASASRRCFVVETMGRKCGYLALMSGLTTGAEQVYLYEDGVTLSQLARDTKKMISSFESGRQLYLVVRNENASEYYNANVMGNIFEQEGNQLFDVRSVVLGHAQQGGNPSPFDRTLAVRLVDAAMSKLQELLDAGRHVSYHVGMIDGEIEARPIAHMNELIDMDDRLPYDPWYLPLKDIVYVVSDSTADLDLRQLHLVVDD
ncbi:6-phosphofructokinase [Trueperella bialowiezensis]|uniref:6-phosphofructokinase n=1 Tax=Trueperella bialowiezensis TaxID=312285 RepID=A0A3S4WFK4_9ACTO|nr:6-phosphofructokinase [Trueperella bialowiezensis]VEI12766.1 6-phosphofructokinase [Trueperella bialowiezensis]